MIWNGNHSVIKDEKQWTQAKNRLICERQLRLVIIKSLIDYGRSVPLEDSQALIEGNTNRLHPPSSSDVALGSDMFSSFGDGA